MAKFTTIDRAAVGPSTTYQVPRRASGVVASRRLSPEGYSLWLCDTELADGGTITWDGVHGDDGLYVLDGELEVGGGGEGRRCPKDGAVLVESGVATTVRAVGPTRVAHFGCAADDPPTDGLLGPAAVDGHGVHVYGPGGRFLSGKREGVHAVWYADATCDTCRAQLLKVTSHPSDRNTAHHHSQDEIIYLIAGTMRLGAYELGAGTALSIPANARYAPKAADGGHVFLNFRRDVSEQVYARSEPALLETALSRGGELVDDLR
jgi:quercetin dioxygenase-like cupin family protein